MVLGFYQNRKEDSLNYPEFIGFINFYADMDEINYGLSIDLSQLFRDEYIQNDNFKTMVEVPEYVQEKMARTGRLYIRDPIGKFYYRADPTGVELQTYRENIGASSWRYSDMVKDEICKTQIEI